MSMPPKNGSAVDWTKFWKESACNTKDLPVTVQEARDQRNAPYYKYPKMMYWQDLHADQPGFSWVQHEQDNSQWPDQTEEWDEEVDELLEDGRASNEVEALKLLYEEDEDFRDIMDELWENGLEYCRRQDRKRRMAVWHRAAWTIVWCRRFRN